MRLAGSIEAFLTQKGHKGFLRGALEDPPFLVQWWGNTADSTPSECRAFSYAFDLYAFKLWRLFETFA